MDPDALMERAASAMRHAHAPYSGFRVGAALLAADGSVHVGCNVESASYGLTMCAERVALFSAVAAGCRRFRSVAVHTEGPAPVAPCGACRQALAEFGLQLRVISEAGGAREEWTLAELLPAPFRGPDLPSRDDTVE